MTGLHLDVHDRAATAALLFHFKLAKTNHLLLKKCISLVSVIEILNGSEKEKPAE